MKKLFLFLVLFAFVFAANAQQLNLIITDASNYNSANNVTNGAKQISALKINTTFQKLLNALRYLDTSHRFNDSSVLSAYHFIGSGTISDPYRIDTTHAKVLPDNIMASGYSGAGTKTLMDDGVWRTPTGSGMTLNGSVAGAAQHSLFYGGAGGTLAQSNDFIYNDATKVVRVKNGLDELAIGGNRDITPYNNGSVAQLDISATRVNVNGLHINSPASGTAVSSTAFDASGNLITGPLLATGTYTPTLNNFVNISSATPRLTSYYRIGNMVTVFGNLDIQLTTGGLSSAVEFSIPVNSTLTSVDAGGTFSNFVTTHGMIVGNGANVVFKLTNGSTSNYTYSFNFSYKIQ
jgi:hypothetical protein